VDTLHQKFLQRTGPLLQELGHELPINYDEASGRWELTELLPWDKWDARTRRLSLN